MTASGTAKSGTANEGAGRTKGSRGRRSAGLATLIERTAAGDRAAFERLYRRTAGSVYALVRRLIVEDAASARVTTEVYVRLWSDAHTFRRAADTAENWVLNLAHGCAVTEVRARADRRAEAVATDAPPVPELSGADARRSVSLLTPAQAEALELAYVGGLTHADTALSLGIDQATFRIRLGTALSRLRQGMAPGTPPSRSSEERARLQT